MSPSDHYAKAESYLAQVDTCHEQIRELRSVATTREGALAEMRNLEGVVKEILPLAAIHATLASCSTETARAARLAPMDVGTQP